MRTLVLCLVLLLGIRAQASDFQLRVHLGNGQTQSLPHDQIRRIVFSGLHSGGSDSLAPSIQQVCLEDTPESGARALEALVSDPSGVAGVEVLYTLNGGSESSAALTLAGGELWTGSLPGLPAPGQVVYRLRAVDASPAGNSGESPACQYAVLELGAPTLSISGPASGQILLSWTALPGAQLYNVYESSSLDGEELLLLGTEATSVVLPALVGVTRIYRVRALY